MWQELDQGAELFSELWNADIPALAIENPVMHKYAKTRIKNYQKFSQSVQPGNSEQIQTARTMLKKGHVFGPRNLPLLKLTGTLDGSTARDECHKAPPGKHRWKFRSKFYQGIAKAMASQWGKFHFR